MLRARPELQTFRGEQSLLAFEAPTIAAEAAVFADDAVAGNNDGDGIGGAGASHGADGPGIADAASNFGIGARLAAGNAPELFPNAALEGGAANVERDFAALGAGAEARDHSAGPGADAAGIFAEIGVREIVSQLAEEQGIGLAEHYGAHAARGGADQQAAQRRIHDGVADFETRRTAMIITRGHAELRAGAFVEAARRTISRVVDG